MIAKDINENVAIIGGGLAVGHASGSILLKNFADGLHGFGLALALHAQSIPCTIYELRGPPYDHRGALMLSPNALRILYNLVIYERIRGKGFSFENVIVKTATGETTDLYSMGNERLYGYKTLRIYRRILKYSRIVSEDECGAEFAFADGSTEKASLLIGADGIYSKVCSYVAPSVTPQSSGFLAITYAVKRSSLRIPTGEDLASPMTWTGRHRAFVLAPQDVDGSEFLAGKQVAFQEQNMAGWDSLFNDKEKLVGLIRKGQDDEPDLVQSALENVNPSIFTIWPFCIVPRLEKWISPIGSVIIVGDPAHAIPPTAGQSANQAFEDGYTLAMLLSELSPQTTLSDAIGFWQAMRQERVDQVIHLNSYLNHMRLPLAEKEELDQ